ncbi:MAG TPA: right-handed parallel beta-helix repeat-containing protein [bacterium]|nr:right-handed parallel beta-helix repeat-containing protein [bacterium]
MVQNGARNSFYELQIEGAAGNGIVIRGDGGNKIDHVAVDGCAQNGILIEGSQLNEIYDTTVSECGESGIAFTQGSSDNKIITVHSTDNIGNGILIADSPHNPITDCWFSGEQAGIALSGQAAEGNRFTQCLIKSVEDPFYDGSPQHGIHMRDGANNTWIDECQIESTIAGHGILVEGEGTTENLIEYCSFSPTSTMKCGQDGICFQGGASGNHLLWIDILYRGGNGITITGPNTEANLIENCYAGNNAGWGLRIENQSFANEVVQGRFKGNGLGGVSIVDVEPRVGDTRIPFFIHNTLIGCQTIVLTPEYYGFQMNDVDPDNAGTGILLQNAQSGFLDRNYILGHDCAFEMQNTAGNLIQRQNIFFSKGDGIVVENSREDRIESVYVMESTRNGIQVLSCTGTAIVGSAAYLNGGSGCVIQSCTAVLLEETALGWNRTNGLLGKNSVDTTIRLCSATRNEENGYVVAEDSVNTVFNRSDADSNRGAGYLLADCRNVTLLGRQLYDGLLIQNNNNYGILVSDAQDVFIGDAGKGVIVAGNGAAGIFVTGANTQNVAITSSLIVNKNVVNQPYYAPDEAFLEQPYGIHIHSGRKIRIGGPSPQEGNHIESPHDVGILIEGENSGVSIVNNNIGEPEGDETDTRSNGNVVGIELRNNACTVSIFDNRIRSNQQVGIRISGGASGNLIQRNHISDNGAHGVVVDGPSSLRNTITRNSIFSNGGKGIASLNGGNTGILPPTVNSMTWEGYNIVGTCDAPNGSVVEVYADHEDEGRILVGSSLVFNKCFYISGFVPPDENLHGIVIDPAGNTSEFGPSDLAGRTESAGSYVFASRTGQGQDVFLKLTNEEVPLQLTNHPAEDYDPQISQDGSEVLFVSNRSGNPDLWILNRNTSEVRQITENASPDYDPDWLAGTDRILFVSDRSGNPEIYLGRTEELQFSDPVRLTDNDAVDRYPVWSPDGSRIAFASSRGGAVDIWVMNSDGSGVVRMTDSVGNNLKPAWSPDGSKIAFVSDRDGNEEVYLLDVASKSITRLTNYSASDTDPTWTRSGGRVLFASNRESGYEMYSLGTGATIPRRLTNMLGDAIQPDAGPSYLSGESASVTLATDPLMPDEGNPGRTLAAAAVHLTLDSVQAKAGETCEIHATLTEAINVANLAFGVEYEPVYLRLLDLSPGVLTENALFAVNPEFYPSDRVPIRQNWIRASAFNGDSPVMTMTFGVDKQAESGVYPIGVLYPVAYDTNFSAIPVTVHPGTITVEGVDVLVEQWMLH